MNCPYIRNPQLILESVIISTHRCILKPLHAEGIDFSLLHSYYIEANDNFYINKINPTTDELKRSILTSIENRKNCKAFECFIFRKDSNEIIGFIGINCFDEGIPNFSIWIKKSEQQKGYGTETYEALQKWIRQETTFTLLKHGTQPSNIGSIHLVEHFQGRLQNTLTKGGSLKYYVSIDQ